MNTPYRTLDEHFFGDGPKRILTLDGGGIRGILSLAYLEQVESILRRRANGDSDFRLCDYFDLIAGTSTGAIIASGLAKGMAVSEIVTEYLELGEKVFRPSFFRKGLFSARYNDAALKAQLQRVLGKSTTLGCEEIKTGLLIVTKRTDTGSPWPLGNNPRGRYYTAAPEDGWASNADYPLWKVV